MKSKPQVPRSFIETRGIRVQRTRIPSKRDRLGIAAYKQVWELKIAGKEPMILPSQAAVRETIKNEYFASIK